MYTLYGVHSGTVPTSTKVLLIHCTVHWVTVPQLKFSLSTVLYSVHSVTVLQLSSSYPLYCILGDSTSTKDLLINGTYCTQCNSTSTKAFLIHCTVHSVTVPQLKLSLSTVLYTVYLNESFLSTVLYTVPQLKLFFFTVLQYIYTG